MVSCLLDANPLIIPAKGTSTPDIKWDNHTRHMKQRAMLKKCLLGQKDHWVRGSLFGEPFGGHANGISCQRDHWIGNQFSNVHNQLLRSHKGTSFLCKLLKSLSTIEVTLCSDFLFLSFGTYRTSLKLD